MNDALDHSLFTAEFLRNLSLILVLLFAAGIDFLERRIPNWLVAGALLVALAFATLEFQLVSALLGLAVGLAIFIPFYMLKAMGAGDVKMMAVVGAFLGPYPTFLAALSVAIVGGVIAFLWSWRYGRLGLVLFNLKEMLLGRNTVGTLENTTRVESIPYALAIALGVIVYLLLIAK